MRVMHVVAPGPIGGLERVVQALAVAQRADVRIADVRVVALRGLSAPGIEAFLAPMRRHGIPVHTVTTPPQHYLRERVELAALCTSHGTEIVHTHGAHADVVAAGVGDACGAASVSTAHGLVGGDWRNQAYEWMQQRSFRSRDAVVAVSRPLARTLVAHGVPPEHMHVVRNVVRPSATAYARAEARERLGLPSVGFVVGWIGRMSREKGLDVLLEALAHVLPPDLRLSLIGDGIEREALERRAERTMLQRAGRIHWHLTLPDAARYLPAFDVLVLSSRTEGTPMVLLEAMAALVPVIASDVGGIPDIVGRREARLVRSEDPAALLEAILEVQGDPRAAQRRALDASTRLQLEGDVDRWSDRYRSVYTAARTAARWWLRANRLTARPFGPASREASAP
jgi:glycosyltransferase involved in cell wall biosynthesis